MASLARTPLNGTVGITAGRRLKLGDDYAPNTFKEDATETRRLLKDYGYRGNVEALDVLFGYNVASIPADTRGIVVHCEHYYGTMEIIFIYKWKGINVAVHCDHVPAERFILSRGANPLPGEPYPGSSAPDASVSAPTAPAQSTTPAPATMSPTAPVAPVASGFDALIAGVVSTLVESRIAELETKVANAASTGPSVVHVQINSQPPRALSAARCHARLTELLKLAAVVSPVTGKRLNIMLVGPAGTGKSMLASQLAEANGLTFSAINGSQGLTEGRLVGTMTPDITTGEMRYNPSELVKCYRDGGVFLLDEIDAMDENVMLSINNLIDATTWQAPDGTRITRHHNFMMASASNTFGLGANRMYSGRTQLDASSLDRWIQLEVGYDLALERSICATSEIVERIHAAREVLASRPQVRRWLTMRAIITADALVQQAAYTVPEALAAVTQAWTLEDKKVCGL